MSLLEKEQEALNKIRDAYYASNGNLVIGYSGGKDSDTILYLARKALDIPLVVFHNPKDDTHPDTVQHIYDVAKQIPIQIVPIASMEAFIDERSLCQIDGTRRDEYSRTDKSTDLIVDGQSVSRENMGDYVEKGLFGMSMLYPIYDWTEEDIWEFILNHNITVSKEYIYV